MSIEFRHSAEDIRKEIESLLQRVGILCRVFGRGKDKHSLGRKLENNPNKYRNGGKLIQDAIGIRVVLYFTEDIEVVARLLKKQYHHDLSSSTIDSHGADPFCVTRHNLIFRIPEQHATTVRREVGDLPIDIAFEIQLRSMLSEGWHEVEHDLRYKSKPNWVGNDDLGRTLNGILATLETSEWTMRKIFDDLAYRNFKAKKWPEMLHNQVRLRVEPTLCEELCQLFNAEPDIAKDIFRVKREKVIFLLSELRPSIPVTLDNIVYVWNYLEPKHEKIQILIPDFIKSTITSLLNEK